MTDVVQWMEHVTKNHKHFLHCFSSQTNTPTNQPKKNSFSLDPNSVCLHELLVPDGIVVSNEMAHQENGSVRSPCIFLNCSTESKKKNVNFSKWKSKGKTGEDKKMEKKIRLKSKLLFEMWKKKKIFDVSRLWHLLSSSCWYLMCVPSVLFVDSYACSYRFGNLMLVKDCWNSFVFCHIYHQIMHNQHLDGSKIQIISKWITIYICFNSEEFSISE